MLGSVANSLNCVILDTPDGGTIFLLDFGGRGWQKATWPRAKTASSVYVWLQRRSSSFSFGLWRSSSRLDDLLRRDYDPPMEFTDIVALIVVLLVMAIWGWVVVVMDRAGWAGLPLGGLRGGKPPLRSWPANISLALPELSR
jgi:hypothetical protein